MIGVWVRFFHSLSRAMYHIADSDKMVQKRPGSCCTGSLGQRNIRGIPHET